jgi:hypothetical protein
MLFEPGGVRNKYSIPVSTDVNGTIKITLLFCQMSIQGPEQWKFGKEEGIQNIPNIQTK